MKREYPPQKKNIYSHRIFQDLCYGFSYDLGEKNNTTDFFAFYPDGCEVEKLFRKNLYINSYEIESIIHNLASSLLKYGKAYLYLDPEYATKQNGDTIIHALKPHEIIGYPLKCKNRTVFYHNQFERGIRKQELISDALIVFQLKELGYHKRYFSNIIKQMGDNDITASSTQFITESLDGYDFNTHFIKKNIKLLQITKDIGWYYRYDDLSDSYILYETIQRKKFKQTLLNYIINKINQAINVFLKSDNVGKLIANTKDLDYDQLWINYSAGKVTGTELRQSLFYT